jgi:hypothetical protein
VLIVVTLVQLAFLVLCWGGAHGDQGLRRGPKGASVGSRIGSRTLGRDLER